MTVITIWCYRKRPSVKIVSEVLLNQVNVQTVKKNALHSQYWGYILTVPQLLKATGLCKQHLKYTYRPPPLLCTKSFNINSWGCRSEVRISCLKSTLRARCVFSIISGERQKYVYQAGNIWRGFAFNVKFDGVVNASCRRKLTTQVDERTMRSTKSAMKKISGKDRNQYSIATGSVAKNRAFPVDVRSHTHTRTETGRYLTCSGARWGWVTSAKKKHGTEVAYSVQMQNRLSDANAVLEVCIHISVVYTNNTNPQNPLFSPWGGGALAEARFCTNPASLTSVRIHSRYGAGASGLQCVISHYPTFAPFVVTESVIILTPVLALLIFVFVNRALGWALFTLINFHRQRPSTISVKYCSPTRRRFLLGCFSTFAVNEWKMQDELEVLTPNVHT